MTAKNHHGAAAVRLLVALTVALVAVPAQVALAQGDGDGDGAVQLLVDASGSMNKDAGGGVTRLAAAKQGVGEVIDALPGDARVGLRVYGSRFSNTTRRRGCTDTKLLVPVGPLERGDLRSEVEGLQAKGYTPIGRSLKAAARDLRSSGGRRQIVLVSDGGDNCAPPEPCAVARRIARQGIDLSIQVIGLQVSSKVRRQLRCIARAGGGTYVDAGDPQALIDELRAALTRAFRSYEPTGTPLRGGADMGEATRVPRGGQYLDELRPGDERWYRLRLLPGQRAYVSATGVAQAGISGNLLDSAEFSVGFVGLGGTGGGEETQLLNSVDAPAATDALRGDAVASRGADEFWSRPGDYLLRMSLAAGDIAPKPVPVELAVHVLGVGDTLGIAGEEAGKPFPAEEQGGAGGAGPAGDNGGGSGGGVGSGVLAGVAVLAAGLGVAGGWAAMRRRRAA